MNVEAVMSRNVQVCQQNQTAQSALRLMRDHDHGCIPVVDHGVVVGIVTDRDIALATAKADKPPSKLRLSDIMSRHVYVVRPQTSIREAEDVMRMQHIRRVPVVDDDSRPVGLLSLNDIARAGEAHEWAGADGLTAQRVASTLAAICEQHTSAPRALA